MAGDDSSARSEEVALEGPEERDVSCELAASAAQGVCHRVSGNNQ